MIALALWFVVASLVQAASIDSLYPNLTDPSVITQNTYNAIMKGAKHESRTSASDGSYNYCSMPHPSTSLYKEPEPIKNGTAKANLSNVLYIQRHQKRTAYHIYPHGENQVYDCTDVRPSGMASPSNGDLAQPMPVYAATYVDESNPLNDAFTKSTCQFPQLTIGGFLDGVQHGQELRALYGDKYQVIPSDPSPETVWLRSSTAALTQNSASGVLRGLWPNVTRPLPLHQESDNIDTHEPPCDRKSALLSASKEADVWKKHLDVTASLRKELESMLGTDESDWQADWDHYNDNFQARLCNGYDLPCAQDGSGKCVTKEQANAVFTAGDWEYNYYWVARENVTEAIQLTSGLYIADLIEQLRGMADGSSTLRYIHHFMHDGDIGPLAGSLGIESLRWPGMASNIALELWKTDDHQTYVRVLYGGQTIRSRHGHFEWMPVDQFLSLWQKYVPHNFVQQCSQA